MEKSERIRLELTPEQQKQVKDASGQAVTAIELRTEELEERIAPTSLSYGTIQNVYTPQQK